MPLTEHEERMLAEMERHFASDDPKLAARLATKEASWLRRWRQNREANRGRFMARMEERWSRRPESYGR